ncbi:MAG: hypothetical protein B6241_12220 [Spirochaetaceae bacterium 4572_59]|nr:MAG: hypothetical protein B6241_12220 [Spirochaetaceae bacterium 4572_59]
MVNKKFALLFPGQGAQYPGMGKDLWDRYDSVKSLFQKASDSSGKNMEKLLFEGSEEDLKATENTQIAITLVSLSVRACLQEEGLISSAAAGVSLGEYSAMVDTGILTEEDVFKLVVKRGDIMARAGNRVVETMGEAGMGAVIGLNFEQVSELVAAAGRDDVFAANNNSPVQVVVSGTKAGVEAIQGSLKEAGAISFKNPVKDFYSNVTGSIVNTGKEVQELCIQQMVSPVQWLVIENNIGASGMDIIIEAGPGSVLTGLWKKSGMDQNCWTCGKAEDIDSLLNSLRGE